MALATDPGTTGIPYVTAGAFALSVIAITNAGNSLTFGAIPATAGDIRFSNNITAQGRNSTNTNNIALLTFDSSNNIQIGDQATSGAVLQLQATTSVRAAISFTTMLQLNAAGSTPTMQLPTGSNSIIQPLLNATAASGIDLTVQGQNRTAATGTSVGGTANLIGGDATGATATHTGGMGSGRGGSATGASGTRTGGDFWAGGGTGATRNGNVYIGFTTPAAFNWQSMGGGVAIQNASAAPAGNPTGAYYLYSNAGALTGRGTGGTVTVIGPA